MTFFFNFYVLKNSFFFEHLPSFLMAGLVPVFLGGLEPSDILYNALPLYHSSAGMLALGPSFRYGISVTLRVKFSASNFWKDCVKYNCTVRYC